MGISLRSIWQNIGILKVWTEPALGWDACLFYGLKESWKNAIISLKSEICHMGGVSMTAIRQEAMRLLEEIPEDKLNYVIQIMQGVSDLLKETEKKTAIDLDQFVMPATERGQDADQYIRELRDHDRF